MQPLIPLGYTRLTVTASAVQTVTPPVGTNTIVFTCEDNPIRWIAGSAEASELTAAIGNPLMNSWGAAFWEYALQTSSPISFISQSGTAKVNVNFYG